MPIRPDDKKLYINHKISLWSSAWMQINVHLVFFWFLMKDFIYNVKGEKLILKLASFHKKAKWEIYWTIHVV